MNLNDAGRLVAVIDNRIRRLIKSEAQVETTWGEVCGISADGMLASAYLYGSSDPSEGFRIPGSLALAVGDKVKVAWDGRGDRYVVEAANPGPYKKVEINASTGEVLTGDGSAPPTPLTGSHDELTDVSADDHHAKLHAHDGADGSGAVSHDDLTDVSADDHHTENHQARHLEGGADELAGALRVQAASGTTKVLSGKRSADSGPRWQVTADGTIEFYATPGDAFPIFRLNPNGAMEWGAGSGAVDVVLDRSAANTLRLATGDRLTYEPVGCSLFRSATQSIPNGTWTAVNFNESDLSDPFGMHDPSTNNTRITIPSGMGGAYRVTAQGSFNANVTGSRFLGLSFNAGGASEINQVGGPPTTAHNYRLSLSGGVYEMAAGDYVELLCWQDAGGNLNLNYATLYLHYVGEIA